MRPSRHHEPEGALAVARHYIGDVVYGANDGLITTFAVVAGVTGGGHHLGWSVGLTFTMLFAVGALRALVTVDRWWVAGLEMLGLGMVVAATACASGALVARLTGTV